jgi:hypothetical protein
MEMGNVGISHEQGKQKQRLIHFNEKNKEKAEHATEKLNKGENNQLP